MTHLSSLAIVAEALLIGTFFLPEAVTASCVDDPNYISPFGLSCKHHQRVNCNEFAKLDGMSTEQVKTLLRKCPSSCRIDGCTDHDDEDIEHAIAGLEMEVKSNQALPFERSLQEVTCFGGKCRDDPSFRSKFFLPCESHSTFECGVLQAIGFTNSEVEDLITSCPCSCRTECAYMWTEGPTPRPSRQPTPKPSPKPSKAPTSKPSKAPSSSPTKVPTLRPTTASPTRRPTLNPTVTPGNPTRTPTLRPSRAPATISPTQGDIWNDGANTNYQTQGEIWENQNDMDYNDPIGDQTFGGGAFFGESPEDILHNNAGDLEAGDSEDGGSYIHPSQVAAAQSGNSQATNDDGETFVQSYGLIILASVLGGVVLLVAVWRYVRYKARSRVEKKLVRSLAMEYQYGGDARGPQPNDTSYMYDTERVEAETYDEEDRRRHYEQRYSSRGLKKGATSPSSSWGRRNIDDYSY
mmetsp:Transcript_25591/g.55979  ORF Transcript_25591/g.55979 Transcript_25591/m.55979 type:complete len:465 (-) Transcript_25591:114-1508(-)